MSEAEILKQEEIDALLGGVDSGEIVIDGAPLASGTPCSYDFRNEIPVSPGRLPKLAMINERFARLFRVNLASMLRHSALITVAPVAVQRFGEFIRTLPMPSSINLVRVGPLSGTAAVVFAPTLVSAVVNKYFGGSGRTAQIDGRDFTAAESRIVEVVRKRVFADLKEAWSVVASIDLEILSTETNPQFVNQISLAEIMVTTSYHIDLDGDGGDLQIVLPHAMLEPLRERLDSGVQGAIEKSDQRWYHALREEVEYAKVDIRTVLGCAEVSLGRLLELKPGDVLPFDFAGQATVYAEDIPIFRGSFGGSRGQEAVKIESGIRR